MEQNVHFQLVYNRFEQDGFNQHKNTIAGIPVNIAHKQRGSRFISKMDFFGIFGIKESVSKEDIERFSIESFDYAKKIYKGTRGLSGGFAALPALFSAKVDPAARELVKTYQKKHFASFEVPTIVDLTAHETLWCRDTPILGGLVYGTLQNFIWWFYRVES